MDSSKWRRPEYLNILLKSRPLFRWDWNEILNEEEEEEEEEVEEEVAGGGDNETEWVDLITC